MIIDAKVEYNYLLDNLSFYKDMIWIHKLMLYSMHFSNSLEKL